MSQHDAPGKQGNAVKQPPTRSALKLLHERREVRDFPMLRELSVLDSVELKGHRVDLSASGFEANEFAFVRIHWPQSHWQKDRRDGLSASGFEANEFAFVRAADGIQDSDAARTKANS